MKKLVFGWGINNADYLTSIKVENGLRDGKRSRKTLWDCPFHKVWTNLLKRCYRELDWIKNPSYQEANVDEEWKKFMDFRAWMTEQNWQGNEIDKDILFPGNKTYSSEFCVFVPAYVNLSILSKREKVSSLPIGVTYREDLKSKPYRSKILSQEGKTMCLGYHPTPEDAHFAWQLAKVANLKSVIQRYVKEDNFETRVVRALEGRIEKLSHDNENGIITIKI